MRRARVQARAPRQCSQGRRRTARGRLEKGSAADMAYRMNASPKDERASQKLFGTDGVRGVANVYPMTAEVAMQLGRALAHLIRNGPHRHKVIIGKDTRLSGYMLEQALAAG